MRGLTFDGSLRLRDDLSLPKAGQNEAIIAVDLAGICNTDLEIVRGYNDFHGILGHEFVGTVHSCQIDGWVGKRVVGGINLSCGDCDLCRAGHEAHCRNRTVLGILGHDGAFSDFVSLPVRNLLEVPPEVCNDAAVFAEPLAAAFEILEQVNVGSGDRIAVLGDGKLGLLCAQVLASTQASVLLLGKHAEKLEVARALGLDVAMSTGANGHVFDMVIEATGSADGFEQSLRLVRPRGTIVLKSTIVDRLSVDLSRLTVNEITVLGSRCGPLSRALEALAQRTVLVTPLIDCRFPLADGVAAMERAAQPGVLKVLLDPGAA